MRRSNDQLERFFTISVRAAILAVGLPVMAYAAIATPAAAQSAGAPKSAGTAAPTGGGAGTMERLAGVWVEGPGFEITYGGSYDGCAQKCLAHAKCAMIEYYRPEKKCNLYDAVRPRKSGGSSDVAIRR
jgi:PAN domain